MTEWISSTEAGKLLGVSRHQVYRIAHWSPDHPYPIRVRPSARNGWWEYHAGDCHARKVALDEVKRLLYRRPHPNTETE